MSEVRGEPREDPDLGGAEPAGEPVHRVGALTVALRSQRAYLGGQPVPFRNKEFELLARLASAPGTISRQTLMADVWDVNFPGLSRTLDVHVAAIRRKLAEAAEKLDPIDPTELPRIITSRGRGYRLIPSRRH